MSDLTDADLDHLASNPLRPLMVRAASEVRRLRAVVAAHPNGPDQDRAAAWLARVRDYTLPPMVMRTDGEETWHRPRDFRDALCGHCIGSCTYAYVAPGDVPAGEVCAECVTVALAEVMTGEDYHAVNPDAQDRARKAQTTAPPDHGRLVEAEAVLRRHLTGAYGHPSLVAMLDRLVAPLAGHEDEAAVERMAEALHDFGHGVATPWKPWAKADEGVRDDWRERSRAALAAAGGPHTPAPATARRAEQAGAS